ncbi:cytochrome c [uncultured Roseovarius sp.]|uniref:c-type cytochrome n=1 Tax=uncultured Roseovarius sp. TaxID=293344 RepID=UPI0025EEC42D|nr:cytochrome c [uncultured Roseovarius sp.]
MAYLPRMVAMALVVAVYAGGVPLQAQPTYDPETREPVVISPTDWEFNNSCASCHGEDGKGAGFLTRVFRGVNPGDLTRLAADNGGTFPVERVYSVIDGRAEVAAHGESKMPVWGDRYMTAATGQWGPDELNELRVRNRIYALVHYLQSIQVPAE